MDDLLKCALCDKEPGIIFCSCEEQFCETCYKKRHLKRRPNHRLGGTQKTETFWEKVSAKISGIAGAATLHSNQFKKDEATKWFGLQTRSESHYRVSTLVETPRFRNLMEDSLHFRPDSPKRQFPSIISFVGFTGAGKSLLIRTLMYHAKEAGEFESLEAPIPGAQSGSSAMISTTGEVNLYLEPSSFGTANPMFFVDCEGMLGTEPLAAQHQSDWTKHGRKYEIEVPMDRRTAVQTLYPRFLYIFSDVVCYATRDHKSWADLAVRLMEWSDVGAQNTINQSSLPALIIILNAPTLENEAWVSDDQEAATRDFFNAVDEEIRENNELRDLAAKYGDKNMKHLFSRSYSSVYVHYVPLKGWGSLGTSAQIYKQTERLSQRIKSDTMRVQTRRAESWTRFDTEQMSLITEYAFDHLRKGTREPFDFGQCRQKIIIPDSTELHFAEFLGHCLDRPMEEKFDATAAVLGTAILKNSVSAKGKDLVLRPSAVFDEDIQTICRRAISHFLDNSAQCSYVDPASGKKCVNTKAGHAQGHQQRSGRFLADGLFAEGDFDTSRFLRVINETVVSTMEIVNVEAHAKRRKWQLLVAKRHRENIQVLRKLEGYPSPDSDNSRMRRKIASFLSTSVCYGCLFGKPEYRLPCGHTICETCLRDNDQVALAGEYERVYGVYVHKDCFICGDSEASGWPYEIPVQPDLSGFRVLSLDGGGVRGIVELVVLERLENLIGLGIPIGSFFDLIVGTSTGGIIAMGLGAQSLTAKECIDRFRSICRDGFKNKLLTNTWGISWLARWLSSSIYSKTDMEWALCNAFGITSPDQFFGLKNHCRVAITTTVHTDCKLIANYNRGGGDDFYLNSELHLWQAARCTSAAPMFFEPMWHSGVECRDGGLKENNPLQIAVNESKKLWGKKVPYDLILSVGTGLADAPQPQPISQWIIPSWLSDLFTSLLSSMNGEDAWLRYKNSQPQRIMERSSRLNVRLRGSREPALDAVEKIDSLEDTARSYNKFDEQILSTPFSPFPSVPEAGMLETLADRLRASLFYLRVKSISQLGKAYIVKGYIRCRIGPNSSGFHKLLDETVGFNVKKTFYAISHTSGQPMDLEVGFAHQSPDEPIRIDTKFKSNSHLTTISGFPMKLKTLLEYWESNGLTVEPVSTVDGEFKSMTATVVPS